MASHCVGVVTLILTDAAPKGSKLKYKGQIQGKDITQKPNEECNGTKPSVNAMTLERRGLMCEASFLSEKNKIRKRNIKDYKASGVSPML